MSEHLQILGLQALTLDWSSFSAIILPVITFLASVILVILPRFHLRVPMGAMAPVALLIFLGLGFASEVQGEGFYYSRFFVVDEFSQMASLAVVVLSFFVFLMFYVSKYKLSLLSEESLSLFFLSLSGVFLVVQSNHLLISVVGIDVSFLAAIALSGFLRNEKRTVEAAFKSFFSSAVGTAFFFMGAALLYAASGTLVIQGLLQFVTRNWGHWWVMSGAVMIIVGFAIKLPIFPFHSWLPDTVDASPAPLSAYFLTVFRVALIVFFLRLVGAGMQPLRDIWMPALQILAIVSIVGGGIFALVQSGVKRMLAYTSIVHNGFLAICIASLSGLHPEIAAQSAIILEVFFITSICGLFLIVSLLESEKTPSLQIRDLDGFGLSHRAIAVVTGVLVVFLAGLPPGLGFLAKVLVFRAAVSSHLTALAIFAIFGNLILVYCYLRVLSRVFFARSSNPIFAGMFDDSRSKIVLAAAGLSALGSLFLGTALSSRLVESVGQVARGLVN